MQVYMGIKENSTEVLMSRPTEVRAMFVAMIHSGAYSCSTVEHGLNSNCAGRWSMSMIDSGASLTPRTVFSSCTCRHSTMEHGSK
jgi:hypothetical protein